MNKRKMTIGQIRHSNATTPHTDDYTLYETPTSKGDAKMTRLQRALDTVLQETNAGTLNDTTLFYWNGTTLTGTQSEIQQALTETTRREVQAVLTHGTEALLATLDGWYDEQVEEEVLGEIETWEDFKTHLPEEYEQDLQEIYLYLHSQEMTNMLDELYEETVDEDEEVIEPQTQALHTVLQDTNPGTANDHTLFFTDGTYETGTIHELAGAVDGRDRKEIRAAISHGTNQLIGALDGWYGLVDDEEALDHISSWKQFYKALPEEYEQDLEDLWRSAKADEEQIIDKVYSILKMQKGGC